MDQKMMKVYCLGITSSIQRIAKVFWRFVGIIDGTNQVVPKKIYFF
jgi:hypothetical protein